MDVPRFGVWDRKCPQWIWEKILEITGEMFANDQNQQKGLMHYRWGNIEVQKLLYRIEKGSVYSVTKKVPTNQMRITHPLSDRCTKLITQTNIHLLKRLTITF